MSNECQRVHHLAREIETVNKSTAKSLTQMQNLNKVLPNVNRLLEQTKGRQSVLSQLGADLEAKMAELRQKTALARDQANRIGVGVTFYANSTLQLHNPEGLARAATANRFSLFFRTVHPDGFLAYLGNTVNTSKQLRRTLTDDYMALEINNGYLKLTTDLGSGPQSIVHDRYVADNVW